MLWVTFTLVLLSCTVLVGGAWLGIPLVLRGIQTRAMLSHCRSEGVIALTYDDGPSPEVTPAILDLLDELKVKATFFMIGDLVDRNPDLARLVIDRGHEVASHSMRHLDAWKVGPLRGIRDVSAGVSAMHKESLTPMFFRPPKGRATLGSIFQAFRLGCRPLWWTHDSGDSGFTAGRSRIGIRRFLKHARYSTLTPDRIGDMLNAVSREQWITEVAEQGGVVLFHDAPRATPELNELTMAATRDLVAAARGAGMKFVLASALR